MSIEASEIAGEAQKRDDQTRTCPECSGEMSMAEVIRLEGSSGMFWLCDDQSCAALVNKSGVQVDQLELR